jgi:hypothetical protein
VRCSQASLSRSIDIAIVLDSVLREVEEVVDRVRRVVVVVVVVVEIVYGSIDVWVGSMLKRRCFASSFADHCDCRIGHAEGLPSGHPEIQ